MRWTHKGAAILGIALGCWGCGDATITTATPDSGHNQGQSPNPQPRPDGGDAGEVVPPLPATLSGQVTLLGAASNAGASVTIVETGTSPLQTVTDANGSYFVDDLPAGDFAVTFAAPGYQSQTQTGTVAAGDSAQVSVSLEHSRSLFALASAPTKAATLNYAQWSPLADGGRAAGTQLFYCDPSQLLALDSDPDAGVAQVLLTDDGGLRFLGFDREGGAIVQRSAAGSTEVDFADVGVVSPLQLGPHVGRVMPVGDQIFFAVPEAAAGHNTGHDSWSAITRGDIGPTPLAQDISALVPAVVLGDSMVGWSIGTTPSSKGFDTPLTFGPGFSDPIDSVCSPNAPPLSVSSDGQRFAFLVRQPVLPPISVTPPPPDPEACRVSSTPLAFISGPHGVRQIADTTLTEARAAIYPLTESAYVGTSLNPDSSLHLFVHAAAKAGGTTTSDAGWTSEWESDVDGWAPLQGSNLLAAERTDGGLTLEALGQSAVAGTLSVSASIPFAHTWAAPLAMTPDNRFVILSGIAALFDLQKQAEIPLVVTPVSVQFDRLETMALLLDRSGEMVLVELGGAVGTGPQGVHLEGSAVAVSFTPAEDEVAYAGTDAFGVSGVFVQTIPVQ